MTIKMIFTIVLLAVIYTSSVQASPHTRIIGGSIAHIHQFPWHCSLQITTNNSPNLRYCGGSLISNDLVLTGAWCLQNAVSVQVDMGSVSFLNPGQTQISTTFVQHNQYNAEFNTNNIGLIRLPQPIAEYTNSLRAILLPFASQSGELHVNVPVDVSGYGVTEIGGNFLSDPLRFAQKITITNEQCIQSFGQQLVTNSNICAIGINNTPQTACFGDQGGPLVVQFGDTWLQIGILSSLPPTGCSVGYPVIYTRLTAYIDWIRTMTGIYRP